MQRFEYKVVPAPTRTKRVRGVKTPAGRFAVVMTEAINEAAAEGWEYLRSDSMPVEEKPGLLKRREENYYTVLVFRRALDNAAGGETAVPAAPAVPVPPPMEDRGEPVVKVPSAAEDIPAEPPLQSPEPEAPRDYAPEEVTGDSPFSQPSSDDSPFAEPGDRDENIAR